MTRKGLAQDGWEEAYMTKTAFEEAIEAHLLNDGASKNAFDVNIRKFSGGGLIAQARPDRPDRAPEPHTKCNSVPSNLAPNKMSRESH